jgi:exonuclease SbcC
MRLSRVRLVNFCQHKDKDVELPAGVVGVLGSNGSGKSNFIRGILRAITGTTGGVGKKEEDLAWGAEKGYVRVDFEAGGKPGHIQRDLLTARCTMEYAETKHRTSTEVDEAIYGIIGVSARMLDEMVFVKQGQIEGVLFSKPAERSRSFQSLFGTEGAERIRDLLQEELQGIVLTSRKDVIVEVRQRQEGMKAEAAQCEQDVQTALRDILLEADAQSAKDKIALHHSDSTARAMALAEQSRMPPLQKELSEIVAKIYDLVKRHDETMKVLEESRPLVEGARKNLAAADAIRAAAAARDRAEKLKVDAEAALALVKPVLVPLDLELERTRADARAKFNTDYAIVTTFTTAGGTCPTCKQPLSVAHLEAARARFKELEPTLKSLDQLYAENQANHRASVSALSAWESSHARAERDLAEARQILSSATDLRPPSEETLRGYREFVRDFDVAEHSFRALRSELDVAESRRKHVEAELARIGNVNVPELHVSASECADLHRRLESHTAASARRAELANRLASIYKAHSDANELVRRYEAEEAQTARLGVYRNLCERTRAVLHRDSLPNLVARGYLRLLNSCLAKYLEIFAAPFAARINDDLSISCFFGSNNVLAERLSGGQKVCLGIAFRFAVYELFTAKLGVLVLDEPTVYLDRDRVDSVVRLLERVKGYSKSAGLQVIVVTHEERLAGVFDGVIRL